MQATQSSIASGMTLGVQDGSDVVPLGSVEGAVEMWAEPLPPLTLLVVDDDGPVRSACREAALRMGFVVLVSEDVPQARRVLQREPVDLALVDLKMPGTGGLALFETMKREHPETGVVVMTAFATVVSAVEAMRLGAVDYLTKPFALDELTSVLERARQLRQVDVRSRRLRERLRTVHGMGELVGQSVEMEKLYRFLSKVAFSTHPVLILGESGTGKELVARSIHTSGPSAKQPFIPVDCGALTPTLIESELFGHVKGAFTGADKAKEGLLVAAGRGTIFLDEIGELPLEMQAKLLRALQEKEVRPLGSTQSVPVNARVLAATNRDLKAMVERGTFRKDLYFRLNVVNLRIPPLRDRREDIPLLAMHVLERLEQETGVVRTFSEETLRVMQAYDWPGNVRELENAVERACALSSGPVVHLADLPTQLQDFRRHREPQEFEPTMTAGVRHDGSVIVSIAEMEKKAILATIRKLKGDKLMAAKLLGIGKTTLYRKLKEYGITEFE